MILYRVVGTGTSILSQKKEGDKLRIMGPLGNGFKMPEAQDTAILIAGGMGSAPLFFLANSLKEIKSELMTGFRNNEETVESDTIIESSIKQSIATNDGSRGYHGLVTDLLETYIRTEGRSPDSLKIYACGPFPMLKKTASIAAMHHIFCQVSLESHMACGLGACQGCAVKTIIPESASPYRHVCLNGPVFLSTDIDWNDL
jgi:dihydroorotate dehydrogenase electron transfer subunit